MIFATGLLIWWLYDAPEPVSGLYRLVLVLLEFHLQKIRYNEKYSKIIFIFVFDMGQLGQIEIHIVGKKGNNLLAPDNYDIREIALLLKNIEDLLYPGMKGNRPTISYKIESGSVRNLFSVTKQAETAFAAIVAMVALTQSIDDLELPSARAIEQIQTMAIKNNYDFEFKTAESDECLLQITPNTHFYRSESMWVEAELYFYGTLVDAGGKDKSNIHLETKDFGTIVVSVDRETLKNEERNLLYKEYGLQAIGKQNIVTGEIDRSSLKLLKIIDYNPTFDKNYLNGLINKVGNRFDGIDVDEYISKIRGSYA